MNDELGARWPALGFPGRTTFTEGVVVLTRLGRLEGIL